MKSSFKGRIIMVIPFLFLLITAVHANEFVKYEWEHDRKRYELSPDEEKYVEYVLKNHDQFDYVFENDDFVLYRTSHWIIRVNNNEAIQHFNRIYISMRDVLDLVDLKARSINSSGKVVNFDISNLKEVKDEEAGGGYRIFAIEGVEQGSEIEYYYTLKKEISASYDRVFTQFSFPVKESTFQLTSPKHLKFDFKSYGGYPVVSFSEMKEGNRYVVGSGFIPALREENFASYTANRQRIEFKLAYNVAKSNARLYTWDDAAKTFYRVISQRSKDEDKEVEKFTRSLSDKSSESLESRIRKIEEKIKLTIPVDPNSHESDLGAIIKQKVASRVGITRLLFAVFEVSGIKVEPVITCDRSEIKFDKDFDSWSFLDYYLLYFPDVKGFIAPYAFETRYPLIPSEYTAQYGLFIEPFQVGDVKSGLASTREIPAADYRINTDDLDVVVDFNTDFTSNNIKMNREFGGVNASFVAPYYHLMKEDQKRNMVEEITKQTAPDLTLTKWEAKPVDKGVITNFQINVEFSSTHFLEKAGPRILFKVGELIGPQVEMYREDNRMTPIENDYNRGYNRKIVVNIPEGYRVRNPEDLKINVIYKDGDKQPYLFVSDFTTTGNVLTIEVKEYYKEIYAPIERYEDYRKVINAAADFNKITLVLEKK